MSPARHPQATFDPDLLALLSSTKTPSPQQMKRLQARALRSEAPAWMALALWLARAKSPLTTGRTSDQTFTRLADLLRRRGRDFLQPAAANAGQATPVSWHCQRPDHHLLRAVITTMNALGKSPPAGVTSPEWPDSVQRPEAVGYVRSSEMALRWLHASAEKSAAHPEDVPWQLSAAGIPACTEAHVRVLLQLGEDGALAVLRLRAVREPGAHLLLAPMPTSVGLLLGEDFGRTLDMLPTYLRQTLQDVPTHPALLDIALAWDLAPAIGEETPLDAIEGNSAGAAFACAALLALAPYAPPELQNCLWAARDLMGEAFMTAAIDTTGQLQAVGGLNGKTTALRPLIQALNRWAARPGSAAQGRQPLYLAANQPLPRTNAERPWSELFEPKRLDNVSDILTAIAWRAQPPSPVHDEALALVLAHAEDLTAAAAALARDEHQGLRERLSQAPVHHWRHLAVRDLARWEHQGGPLQTEFVPLTISGRSGGAWGSGRYMGLEQLLAELDPRLNPTAFALEGPPGAGKTTLLRHHMQWLSHRALAGEAPNPSQVPGKPQRDLPMYLSLAGWPDTAVPKKERRTDRARAQWFQKFVREQVVKQLDQEGWSPALRDSLYEKARSGPWVWRWLIDGLNEVPHPTNETRAERARAIVAALKVEFGMRLPMLLSVREDHMSAPDWTWVRVEAWESDAIEAYLLKRFASLDREQPGEAQATARKVLELLKALPESSRSLYTRPMALAMLCDVYLESPAQGLPPHRAALYTAQLWFLLRRELNHTRHTPRQPGLFKDNDLLSAADREWIEQAARWPDAADQLPQQGLLLRGLMDQAEHQYWVELDRGEKQDQRCTVAMPLDNVQVLDAKGNPVKPTLRKQWLNAVEVLGLADPVNMRKGEFRFSHQSWGEYLASVRLLRGTPEALAVDRARGDAVAQARWHRIFEQTREPEAGRADPNGRVPVLGAEAELQAMAYAWGAVPHAVWDRLLEQGLAAPLDDVFLHLSPDKAHPVSEAAFWNWVSQFGRSLVTNPGQSDPETDSIWPDGLGGLHLHPGRWATRHHVIVQCGHIDWSAHAAGWHVWYRTLWPPFKRAFDRWLRAQPELSGEAGAQRVKALLSSRGGLGLPPPADTREVLTLALCNQAPAHAATWLAALITQGDWRAAVPAALQLRPLLEAPKPGLPVNDGHWFDEPGHRHPVLQHLRRLLLQRAVDAGAAVRQRLRRGGVIPALAQPVNGLDAQYPALASHWRSARAQAFSPGPGVDLRERLQAGLWLGELGDNLRYLRWTVSDSAPGGAAGRVGICLHPRHWRGPGRPGQRLAFRIGDDNNGLGQDAPEWTIALHAARLAAYPVTVMEYAALAGQLVPPELQRVSPSLKDPERNNPLMPLTGINWEESVALTAWYRPVYKDLIAASGLQRWQAAGYRLELPNEVQREAWARGPAKPGQPQAAYTHCTSADDPPLPLLFNHFATGWQRPHPVGVFSRGLNPWGIDDLAGNVWNWCSNASPPSTSYTLPRRFDLLLPVSARAIRAMPRGDKPWMALRGGSFNCSAHFMPACIRNSREADLDNDDLNDVGLRWQMSRPIF